jgi:integrase
MAREPIYVYSAKYTSPKTGKTVTKFYARFYSEDGIALKTKTLKATTAGKAGIEAKTLYETDGLARLGEDPLVLDYLLDCYTYDSEYVRRRSKREKGPLSHDYISISALIIKKHLTKPLKGIRMSKINIRLMEKIVDDMAKQGTSPKTINSVMTAFKIPFRDYCRKHNIPNPIINAKLVDKSKKPKERGILSIEEMDKLIALEGCSPRVKAAVLLGGLCGLRLGECRGIMPGDIDRKAGILHISHNFISSDFKESKGKTSEEKTKLPKNGKPRTVPLVDAVLTELDLCIALPHKDSDFILFNDASSERPIDNTTITNGFKRMLIEIGITEEERKKRNLVFHGLRHHYVSRGLASGLSSYEIQQFAGHQSDEMMNRYSNHIEVIDFNAAKEKLASGKKQKLA